jgi:hypothetical protein
VRCNCREFGVDLGAHDFREADRFAGKIAVHITGGAVAGIDEVQKLTTWLNEQGCAIKA